MKKTILAIALVISSLSAFSEVPATICGVHVESKNTKQVREYENVSETIADFRGINDCEKAKACLIDHALAVVCQNEHSPSLALIWVLSE